jgi:hypothetical protein
MIKNKNRGRPKGSNSTVRVKLKDLTKHLTSYSTVCVGKTWLNHMGFNIDEKVIVKLVSINPSDDNVKIEVKDLELD